MSWSIVEPHSQAGFKNNILETRKRGKMTSHTGVSASLTCEDWLHAKKHVYLYPFIYSLKLCRFVWKCGMPLMMVIFMGNMLFLVDCFFTHTFQTNPSWICWSESQTSIIDSWIYHWENSKANHDRSLDHHSPFNQNSNGWCSSVWLVVFNLLLFSIVGYIQFSNGYTMFFTRNNIPSTDPWWPIPRQDDLYLSHGGLLFRKGRKGGE